MMKIMTTFQLNVIAGCYKWILMMHVVLQKLESGRMWILRSRQIMPIWLSQKVVEPWTSIFRSWLSFSGMLTCSASLVLLSSLVISCVVYLFGDLGFYHFEGFLFDSESFRGSILFLCLEAIFGSDTFDCWKGSCWVAMALL